jgi:hypothetical protein
LKEKLVKLESEMQQLAAMEKLMLASPDQQISRTDLDSRSMATSGRGSGVVGLCRSRSIRNIIWIVTHEVTNNGSDRALTRQRRLPGERSPRADPDIFPLNAMIILRDPLANFSAVRARRHREQILESWPAAY